VQRKDNIDKIAENKKEVSGSYFITVEKALEKYFQ